MPAVVQFTASPVALAPWTACGRALVFRQAVPSAPQRHRTAPGDLANSSLPRSGLALFSAAAAASGKFVARRKRCGVASSRPRAACADSAPWKAAQESQPFSSQPRPSGLPTLSSEELDQVRRGEQVQRQERVGPTGWGFVVMDVGAPSEVIMSCLEAFKDYPEMIPVVRRANVTSQGTTSTGLVTAKCDYRISKFFLPVSVEHSLDRSAGTVRFDLDENKSRLVLQEASGYWFVEQSPDGPPNTSRVWLCVQSLRASALVPWSIVDYAAERALRRATCWLKPVMEERWKKEQRLRQLVTQSPFRWKTSRSSEAAGAITACAETTQHEQTTRFSAPRRLRTA
eukprot:CAMPEP_0115132930 /NCGR_PEP_ID=MMETSP0227-20121206/54079_1 /TAXON_ID=89957 /ORGANISM="Polarella glacialis, Strain CCMP 1383" /LENGTH=341 /DNA_ID=CAMNT_0002538883 /DNA_START=16 /DNA_END=1041 /DNA_ORIENTATION=+